MNTSVSALRAITSVVFRNLLKPATWITAGILIVLYALVLYLGFGVSYWWFVALIILLPVTLLAASLLAALWYLSRRLMPRPLLPSESNIVEECVDKVTRLLEARATPIPVVMFLIAKDVVRGKGSSYIDGLIADSTGLKANFQDVRALFQPKTLS